MRNWSLYNKEEKIRIDELSTEQVHTILLAISSARMRDWFACQEGDLRWQNITDIADFYEDTHQAKGDSYLANEPQTSAKGAPQPAPKAPERRPLFEDAPDETHNSTLAMESVQIRERRTARRYGRRLKFRTVGFECETEDVSMAGLRLSKPLPSEIARKFRAELIFNGAVLGVMCQRVDDQRLKIVDAEAWEVLKQWIVSW